MSKILTQRQAAILGFIRSYINKNSVPPTVREIGAGFGIAPASVFGHLKRLERKGEIRRLRRGSRSIELVAQARLSVPRTQVVPILGRISAGLPILAEENYEGHLVVEEGEARGGNLFALKVTGDSMVGAGILDGDYVIARHQSTAEHGDIVVACIGDEAVVKRLRHRHGEWWLEPENPAYEVLSLKENAITIQGKVIAVHRWIDKTGDISHGR